MAAIQTVSVVYSSVMYISQVFRPPGSLYQPTQDHIRIPVLIQISQAPSRWGWKTEMGPGVRAILAQISTRLPALPLAGGKIEIAVPIQVSDLDIGAGSSR
jgi:hypothetical protein